MKIFVGPEKNEHPLYRKDFSKSRLELSSPPKTMSGAIILAQSTFPGGMYNPHRDATTWEISRWLYDSRGLSAEAAIYAADEGYKLFKEKK